jgi:hypothetical protein
MQTSFVRKLCKLPQQSLDPHPMVKLRGEDFYHLTPSPTSTIANSGLPTAAKLSDPRR